MLAHYQPVAMAIGYIYINFGEVSSVSFIGTTAAFIFLFLRVTKHHLTSLKAITFDHI